MKLKQRTDSGSDDSPCSASSFTVMKVISSHPDWDEDDGDSEYEVAHFANKADADAAAKSLGAGNGDATHRAYHHYVLLTGKDADEIRRLEMAATIPPNAPTLAHADENLHNQNQTK